MRIAIEETERRRKIQQQYNKDYHIVPRSIAKAVPAKVEEKNSKIPSDLPKDEAKRLIRDYQQKMEFAAKNLQYEKAAEFRDTIEKLKRVVKYEARSTNYESNTNS